MPNQAPGLLPPSQSNFMPAPNVHPGQSFSSAIPRDVMSDPQGLPITYSATAWNGAALPSWLAFDPNTLTFSGTLPPQLRGSYVALLHATDSGGQSGIAYFTIWITPGPPTLNHPTVDQTWATGQAVSLQLPSGTFVDPQNEALTYSITGANGQQLPSWLNFNAHSLSFSGTPPNSNAGLSLGIQLTATNTDMASTTETFNVTFATQPAPNLSVQTPAQNWSAGHPLSWTLPAGTFTDPQGLALTYTAKSADGSPLPSWLQFDASTRTLTGTVPAIAATAAIEVVAANSAGAITGDVFTVTVAQPNAAASPPVLTNPTLGQGWYAGSHVSLSLASDTFTNPQNLPLTYAATEAGYTTPLPAWLTFDPTTRTFTGTVPASGAELGIQVTATNSAGVSASETFAVLADQPAGGLTTQLLRTIPNSSWALGQAIAIAAPAGSFVDPQGLALTFSATLTDGAALPSWLSVDSATGRITGTAPFTGESISVRLTATDPSGYSIHDDFMLNVPNPLQPQLKDSVHDQSWAAGQSINLVLPADSFLDPQGEALTYTATQSNGTALPSWLHFDPVTQSFSGVVPVTAASLTVTVTATDLSKQADSESFAVVVSGTTASPTSETAAAASQITLSAPATNMMVSGGGYDILSLALNPVATSSSAYRLTANGDGSFNLTTAGSSDHVNGVLEIQFADKTVIIANGDNANLARLYQAAFGRAPDAPGLAAWESVYNQVSSTTKASGAVPALAQTPVSNGSTIADLFVSSQEFQNLYGANLSNGAFVDQVYQNVLHRAPDPAGAAAWTAVMNNGSYTQGMVLVGIAESAENVSGTTYSDSHASGWLFGV